MNHLTHRPTQLDPRRQVDGRSGSTASRKTIYSNLRLHHGSSSNFRRTLPLPAVSRRWYIAAGRQTADTNPSNVRSASILTAKGRPRRVADLLHKRLGNRPQSPQRPSVSRQSPQRPARWLPLAGLLFIPALNLFYGALNNDDRGAHSLVTDLDRALPFVPAFIIPYLLWYVFIFGALTLLAYRDLPLYGRTLGTLVLTLLTSYAIYYGYQTAVPRPAVIGDDPLSWLVRFMQAHDAPYNCFPSIHAASSYLLLRTFAGCRTFSNAVKTAAVLFSLLIIASTFFLKQHVFMDAVGAIIVVELARLAALTLAILRKGELKLYGARNDPARR